MGPLKYATLSVFALGLLVLGSCKAQKQPVRMADTYYIDPNRSDSNPGTQDKPWKTTRKVAHIVEPGEISTPDSRYPVSGGDGPAADLPESRATAGGAVAFPPAPPRIGSGGATADAASVLRQTVAGAVNGYNSRVDSSTEESAVMNEALQELVLILSASYAGAVGYGDVYRCVVERSVVGALGQGVINVTILAGDRGRNAFFRSHLSPRKIEVSFTMARKEEPYALAPISGFVDNNRTAWEIGHMREADE